MAPAEKLDPVTLSLANALEDDEPLTGEDLRAIDETRDFLRSGGKLMSLDAFDSMIDARIAAGE